MRCEGRRSWRRSAAVLLAAGVAGLAGCGGEAGGSTDDQVTVYAAASLTDAFTDIADAFTRTRPGTAVTFNFAGSQVLAGQIVEGAPADVFAAADADQMAVVVDAGAAAGVPQTFAGNVLAIAVEPGNPRGIDGLPDLADPRLVVIMPAEEVPAGRYARAALRAAGVAVTADSLERDVRSALAKVAIGEADAAIVYASDVLAAKHRVDGVAIPAAHNVTAAYPIVAVADAASPSAAAAFVAFVRSPAGRQILTEHGFSAP